MLLEKASLTPNGRPEPLHGEVEQLLLDKVIVDIMIIVIYVWILPVRPPSTCCPTGRP